MYADKMTKSMEKAIDETARRRAAQLAYNQANDITPTTINKPIRARMLKKVAEAKDKNLSKKQREKFKKDERDHLLDTSPDSLTPYDKKQVIKKLRRGMKQAAVELDFELAAKIRDKVAQLEN